MEFILCDKQYVEKAETSFNIRLNSHRKDVKKVDANMQMQTFSTGKPPFQQTCKKTTNNEHLKTTNTSKSKEALTQRPERRTERENFWILKLDRLYPKGFNMGLTK